MYHCYSSYLKVKKINTLPILFIYIKYHFNSWSQIKTALCLFCMLMRRQGEAGNGPRGECLLLSERGCLSSIPGPGAVTTYQQWVRSQKALWGGGWGNWERRERVSKNMYKGHMNKAKGGQDWGWKVEMAGVRQSGGREMETTVFEH